MWPERVGVSMRALETNNGLRRSALSRAESKVMPFESRKRMEAKHTPETDVTMRHHDIDGDRLDSSALTFPR